MCASVHGAIGPIDIQAGRIPPTFGAFARREYGAGNPLIGYPLAYQYLTAVRPDALPASTEDVLRMRARGWRPSYPIGSLDDRARHAADHGVPVGHRRAGARRARVVQCERGADQRHAVRSAHARQQQRQADRRPAALAADRRPGARRLGGAGAYVADAALATATMLAGTARSTQQALGVDAEYSRDHWMLRGELIWNQWQVPTLSRTLDATSAFVEGRYKISPGVFVASRIDRLSFSELASSVRNAARGTRRSRGSKPASATTSAATCSPRAPISTTGATADCVTSRGLFAAQLHFWL